MSRKGFRIGTLCILASVLLSGCGDELYGLTSEEQAVIVGYSSHIVSKFNKKQSEGIVDVAAYKAAAAAKEAARKVRAEEAKKEEAEKEKLKKAQEAVQANAEPEYVSLNQALKLGGVDALYKSYKVTESYKETENYMVTANSGNELLVLNVDLANNGNKKVSCDMLSKMAEFKITVNRSVSKEADTTILLNDLGTYQGSINPGETKKTVLLFQFPKGTVKNVEYLVLEVTIGGDKAVVELVSK